MRDIRREAEAWLQEKLPTSPTVPRTIAKNLERLACVEQIMHVNGVPRRRERSIYWSLLPAKTYRTTIRKMVSRFLTREDKEAFRIFCRDEFEIRI
jgi:hypothetical protein